MDTPPFANIIAADDAIWLMLSVVPQVSYVKLSKNLVALVSHLAHVVALIAQQEVASRLELLVFFLVV